MDHVAHARFAKELRPLGWKLHLHGTPGELLLFCIYSGIEQLVYAVEQGVGGGGS